jgi:peptidoglycan lytic transglycosylase G
LRRLIAVVVILGILGFLVSRGIDWWNYNVNTPVSTSSHTVIFHVDPGETSTQIGNDLHDLGLIRSTVAFDLYTRLTNAGPKFQAGTFRLDTNLSLVQIVDALQHGRPDEKRITFPEGFPLRYQASKVDEAKLGTAPNYITGAEYLKAAQDRSWAAKYSFLPAQPVNADFPYEGYIFPDTYLIDPAVGAKGLVQEQLDQFGVVFSADWRAAIAQATSSRPAEDIRSIVIMASMVDREANSKTASDRGNVCSVYYNRLAINMPLGVDATLLYALGRLSPEPTAAELGLDTPYNTRKHAGLPPGPISNPGRAALNACINPPKTEYLFYFTDRQGTTHFETNERDFEADKQKYGVSGS